MINTYDSYLKHPAGHILTVEDALKIYEKMAESVSQCTLEDKMDLWNDCLRNAASYTKVRNDWELMDSKERMEADPGRTRMHNGFITSLNVLARMAATEGKDDSWRGELGEERQRIGDFACFITYITGICNR